MEGQNNNELQKSSPSQSTILSRPIFNELQMTKLRHHFATESLPSEDLKNNLAMEFECSIKAITNWFSKNVTKMQENEEEGLKRIDGSRIYLIKSLKIK